ncbi:MAG: DUF3107 domain-containing protein [Rothia sp. (in: high G+C Gram-positive bacteria)]|uniref:DUF3107 domain-containing protein n=1 Tax=Rothia sp. (in: high G+C Gram-positive bacteria) TaxID=1885016 RepID=UPI0026E00BAC|nr:DUF3107 domain-containing protein [Rothia sp. (in: high G+C Gram-positive bacteria)]MDO5751061.1 DUF3107 domain-containing protein [Rothia sp. (in: high G+C Gram-positive bacteria)]
MEIKIGVRHLTREIIIESKEEIDAIRAKVSEALTNGTLLELVDEKGATTLISGAQIGYVELGTEEKRRVGFAA